VYNTFCKIVALDKRAIICSNLKVRKKLKSKGERRWLGLMVGNWRKNCKGIMMIGMDNLQKVLDITKKKWGIPSYSASLSLKIWVNR